MVMGWSYEGRLERENSMPSEVIAIIISLCGVIIALVIGVLGAKHNNKIDVQSRIDAEVKRAADMASIGATMQAIQITTNETKAVVQGMQSDMTEFNRRLIFNEASVKSAHKRIDDVEDRLNMTHRGGEEDEY